MAMHALFYSPFSLSVSSFGLLLVFPIDLYFRFHFLFFLWAFSGHFLVARFYLLQNVEQKMKRQRTDVGNSIKLIHWNGEVEAGMVFFQPNKLLKMGCRVVDNCLFWVCIQP
jgi:hypothetical protein